MTRKPPANAQPRTHFEQVPVDVVKKIAPLDKNSGKASPKVDSAVARPTSRKAGPDTDAGHFHGVQFYNDPDNLCRLVGDFIGEGLKQGELAVVIATPAHTAGIESSLCRRGADVDALKSQGCLVTIDASDTLELFMTDTMPNPGAFRRTLRQILTDVRRGREHCTVRAYGEMVDLLWKEDRVSAAIRLETLWNQLGSTRDFELLCAYSMGHFYKGAALDIIKQQHTHVVVNDESGLAAPAPESAPAAESAAAASSPS